MGKYLKYKKCNESEITDLNAKKNIKCQMNKTKKFEEWTMKSKFSMMLRGHDFTSKR